MAIKLVNAVIAILGGIGGAIIIFWILNKLAESLEGPLGGPGQTVDVRRARRSSPSPSTSSTRPS